MRQLILTPEVPEVAAPFRRALVNRFPYCVIFQFDPRKVLVTTVFHTACNPADALRRLGSH